jgi:hypothetical protein
MRRLIVIVAGLIAVAGALYAAGPFVACFVVQPIRQRFFTPEHNTPDCGEIPSLTADQRNTARNLALSDSRVTEILGGNTYTVDGVDPWTAGSCLVGAVVDLHLSEPRTVTMDWPFLHWNEADSRPIYPPDAWRATIVGLAGVRVSVDLDRREVVQIHPGDGGRIVEPLSPRVVLQRVWLRLTYCPQ